MSATAHSGGRWRLVIVAALALVIGVSGWLRFGYERSPDPQRITIVATKADVAFVLERNPGDPVAGYQLYGAGFSQRSDGVWEATQAGARITYSGSVGTRALVRFDTGPDEGRAVVRTGSGPVARVDLFASTPGTKAVAVDTPLRLQPANLLLLVLSIVIGAGIALVVVRVVVALRRRLGGARTAGLLVAVGSVAAAFVLIWIPAPRVLRTAISVEHPSGSSTIGVGIERAGGVPADAFADYFGGPGWDQREAKSVSAVPGAVTTWSGMVSPDDTLEVQSDPPVSSLTVRVDGESTRVKFDAAGRASVRFSDLGADAGATNATALLGSVLGDVILVSIALLLAGAAVAVAWQRVRTGRRVSSPSPSLGGDADWRLTAWLAAIPFVGWLGLLVVFWPGPMNPDAMSQWFQVQDHVLADWHPYVLALFFAGTRQIVDSPWLPILVVMGTASLLVGRFGAWSVARGRSVTQAAVWSLLVLVVPATALHTITLWKDSFYGVGLLALALCLWRIEDSRGEWLGHRRNMGLLVFAAAGTWLVRHNGWPVVLGALVIALIAHRARWRQFLMVAGAVVVIVLFVQVPMARVLDVGPNPVDDILMMQHVSMHLEAGTELKPDERRFLESIRPLDQPWPYDCSSIQATWSGPDTIPLERYTDKGKQLRSLAIKLALRNPRAELRHLGCSSKLVWQPWSSGTSTYFMEWYDDGGRIDYLPVWLDRSPMEEPGNAGLTVAVFRIVDHTPDWLVRPALYLYVLLVAIIVAIRRSHSWAAFRIASPALLQSAALAPVTLVQDVRFQYGVVLVALVLSPLFLTARRNSDPEGPPLVWRGWPDGPDGPGAVGAGMAASDDVADPAGAIGADE